MKVLAVPVTEAGRASAALDRLGHLVQVALSRGDRLAAEGPVSVAWGTLR